MTRSTENALLGSMFAVGMAIGANSAAAQITQQLEICSRDDGAASSSRIEACTAIIQSGQFTGPNLALALLHRGNVRYANMDYNRAIADFNEAIRLNPTAANAFNDRAIARRANGDLDGAITDYGEAIRLDPKSALPYANRGIAYRAKGEVERAIADYGEALDSIRKVRAYSAIVPPLFLIEKITTERSLTTIRRFGSIQAMPRASPAADWRATCSGDLNTAIADFNEAIRINPKSAEFFGNRGAVYMTKRNYESAIADLSEAIRLDPNDTLAFFNRGNAYTYKNDLDHAVADYTEAVRLDARFAAAFVGRAFARNAGADLDGAIADYSASDPARSKTCQCIRQSRYCVPRQGRP